MVGEKLSNWESLLVHREEGFFLSVYVDDIKLAGKKHNIDPMWKVLNKEVDLGEPTSFLDDVFLGCIQRQCEKAKILLTNKEPCLNHEPPREEQKNYLNRKIFIFLRGLMTWKVMRRNVWSDIVSWQTGRLNNSTKYYSLHHFEEEEMKSVGELSKVCSQIVL